MKTFTIEQFKAEHTRKRNTIIFCGLLANSIFGNEDHMCNRGVVDTYFKINALHEIAHYNIVTNLPRLTGIRPPKGIDAEIFVRDYMKPEYEITEEQYRQDIAQYIESEMYV